FHFSRAKIVNILHKSMILVNYLTQNNELGRKTDGVGPFSRPVRAYCLSWKERALPSERAVLSMSKTRSFRG
ncbi:MAG: hypothetical protein K2O48_00845, partial [Prevotella sp.]|nr:hypothetical protein [Prevotella sp.]